MIRSLDRSSWPPMMSYGSRRTRRIVSIEVTDVLDDPEQLLIGVQRNPSVAIEQGTALLHADPTPRHRALAMWTIGMAQRELGELHTARDDARAGLGAGDRARRCGAGIAHRRLAVPGRRLPGRAGERSAHPRRVRTGTARGVRGRLRTQRGVILYEQGDFAAALEQYESALHLLAASGDSLGELRQRVNIGALLLLPRPARRRPRAPRARRRPSRAARPDAPAGGGRAEPGPPGRSCRRPALGVRLLRAGSGRYERSATKVRSAGRCGSTSPRLLHANLLNEAVRLADEAVTESEETEGGLDLAESLLVAAEAQLAATDGAGRDAGRTSEDEFLKRGRPAWAALARADVAARLGGRWATRSWSPRPRPTPELDRAGYRIQAVRPALLAADLRIDLDDVDGAEQVWRRSRGSSPASVLDEVSVLRIRALVALGRGQRAEARRTVNRGVRLLAEHQVILGAIELRADARRTATTSPRSGPAGHRRPPATASCCAAGGDAPDRLAAPGRPTSRRRGAGRAADRAARRRRPAASGERGRQRRRRARPPAPALEGRIRGHLRRAPAGRPGARAARRVGSTARRAGADRVRQPRRPAASPSRSSAGGRRCTTSGGSTGSFRTSTAAATPSTGSTGPRGRRRHERRRQRRSGCSPVRWPSA